MDDNADIYQLALGVLAGTPASLTTLLRTMPPNVQTWSPAPNEWSPSDVLGHMLHVETAVIPVRLRHMLAEGADSFPSVAPAPVPGTVEEMLDSWRVARDENLLFLRTLTPAQLNRSGQHPHYGRISVREHIIEWAYHDLEHLRQLQAILEARLYPAIGGFQALYNPPY